MKETEQQTDTEFLSTVFLCSKFKLENIEFGVNFRRKKVCSNYFLQKLIYLQITGKIAKVAKILCHVAYSLGSQEV